MGRCLTAGRAGSCGKDFDGGKYGMRERLAELKRALEKVPER